MPKTSQNFQESGNTLRPYSTALCVLLHRKCRAARCPCVPWYRSAPQSGTVICLRTPTQTRARSQHGPHRGASPEPGCRPGPGGRHGGRQPRGQGLACTCGGDEGREGISATSYRTWPIVGCPRSDSAHPFERLLYRPSSVSQLPLTWWGRGRTSRH